MKKYCISGLNGGIVDFETGEVRTMFKKGETAYVVTNEQKEGFKKAKKRKDYSLFIGAFTFYSMRGIEINLSELNKLPANTLGALVMLSTYTIKDDNLRDYNVESAVDTQYITLGYSPKNKFKSLKDLENVLKLKNKQVKRISKQLTTAGILKKDNGVYKLSRVYVHRGELKDSKQYVKGYHKYIRQLRNDGLSLMDIGLIFLIIPFISYHYGVLCTNPFEKDYTKINPMTLSELSEVLNIPSRTLQSRLYNLKTTFKDYEKLGVLHAFGRFNNGKSVLIKVNPLLLTRNRKTAEEMGLDMFVVCKKED